LQGQFDWKDGPFSNEKWIHSIDWEGKAAYLAAPRRQWKVPRASGGEPALAGWVQSSGNLTELVINAAGHLAPMDQPERSYDMIYRFVKNQEYITK
jgi:carboxypeptidase C (cathepsin A)